MNLDNASVYDCETFPNAFTCAAEWLHNERSAVWEISHRRDDRRGLFDWFEYHRAQQAPMIGFFSLKFDYPLLHWLWKNPNATVEQIYDYSRHLSTLFDGWNGVVWDRDRFAPQIDLFHIHHFDNIAKRTDLKSLQINMRSETVVDSPVPFGIHVTDAQIDHDIIPYNKHDVKRTKQFAWYSMDAIKFRVGLIPQFGIEVLNFNDVKIGVKLFEKKLGDEVCYDRSSGRKEKRQTPRYRVALNEIVFPYIQFSNPEFQRIHAWLREQVLLPSEFNTEENATVETKGVFKGVNADVGGVKFVFGTGGCHASVHAMKFESGNGWKIEDIDVEALYPSIAIVNGLAPEHLGDAFRRAYPEIKAERKKHAKGTYENGALKLANNGPWGQSNNKHSVFFDPKYAMTVPINGQLMICMLAEWLLTVPTLQIIQVNTDGITYRIREEHRPRALELQEMWEKYTCLTLERVFYKRMWIRDVNNYIAEKENGELKQKGAYWHPEPGEGYADSISKASPPCWYKDMSNIVSVKAAIAAMVHGVDPEAFIRCHTDKFDFMLRVKADKASNLIYGNEPIQRTTRYYVSTDGRNMSIDRPPAGPEGAYKKKNGVTKEYYEQVMNAFGWAWRPEVCTGKEGKHATWGTYQRRTQQIEAGWRVTVCNDARDFRFDNINVDYYVNEAKKLIIGA